MRWPLAGSVLAIAILWPSTGCSNRTSDRDLVFITPDQANALVGGRRGLLGLGGTTTGCWVDPRREPEYRAGHIPDAIHLPYERIRERRNELERCDLIIVYGTEFNSTLAHAASKTLTELGFADVRILRGGLRAWRSAGHPVAGEDAGAAEASSGDVAPPP